MLKRIHLTNFKTFRDSLVPLGPLTLVVGANGVGKSNLFDALRFLKYVGEGRSIRDAIEGHVTIAPSGVAVSGIRGGAKELTHFGSSETDFGLRVLMKVGSDELDYSVRVDTQDYRIIKEELRSRKHPGPYVFSTHPETGTLEQHRESPVIVARFYKETRGLNPKREFSPHEFILSQFLGRRAESRVNEEIAELARADLASIRPLELRPEVIRQYSPLGLFELGEHGENFAAVVWRLINDAMAEHIRRERAQTDGGPPEPASATVRMEAINAWLSELTPRAINSIEIESAPTGEVVFALKEQPFARSISARSLSDGTLRFAAFAVALLGSGGRRTLVVEELENGINPARLQLLIRMLEQTTEQTKDVQVIASTHSPTVLNLASATTLADAIIIGWDAESESSHVVKLSDIPELDVASRQLSLGDLQAEGWLQFAADR